MLIIMSRYNYFKIKLFVKYGFFLLKFTIHLHILLHVESINSYREIDILNVQKLQLNRS